MKEGCFVSLAPKGYINTRTEAGKSTLAFDEVQAPIIRKVFLGMLKAYCLAEQIRKKYVKRGLKLSKNAMLNLLKNPVYCVIYNGLGSVKMRCM